MSDNWLPDTPVVIPPACPLCEPERDPTTYDVRHCEPHTPPRAGADDDRVNQYAYLTGSSEAGGEDNRKWCELFHRK